MTTITRLSIINAIEDAERAERILRGMDDLLSHGHACAPLAGVLNLLRDLRSLADAAEAENDQRHEVGCQ